MYIKVSSVIKTVITEQFIKNDTVFDKSLKARRGVLRCLLPFYFLPSAKENSKTP